MNAEKLMKNLGVTERQANELIEVEAAYKEWYRHGTCTFKKWDDRIYITHSERSQTANNKKNYYDLEAGILHDARIKYEADRD